MNTNTTPIATRTLDGALAAFLRAQEGKNRRPVVLFGQSPAVRARETGTPRSSLYRQAPLFSLDGTA